MSFREALIRIVESVDGGLGAVIMGYDGIAIDEYMAPDSSLDVHLLAVEYVGVLKEIKKAAEVLDTGSMEAVSIATESSCLLVRALNADLFVALMLTREGNQGKGRYLLRRDAHAILESLEI